MKHRGSILLIILTVFMSPSLVAQFDIFNREDYLSLEQVHDIPALHSWGPYSKNYAGISHIPVLNEGSRFDVTVVPGFYRNRVMVPNVLFESGYFPWQINADMTHIAYRYELEWKDRVYVDVTYHLLDTGTVLVEMKCTNETELPQALQLNLLANYNYPSEYPERKAIFPDGTNWINAMEYVNLEFATPRPSDHLVYDGWLRGEERESCFLEGRGLGKGFGSGSGDEVVYRLNSKDPSEAVALYYRLPKDSMATLKLSGFINRTVSLPGTGDFELFVLPRSEDSGGGTDLKLESVSCQAMQLNGLFIGPVKDLNTIHFEPLEKKIYPQIIRMENQQGVILKYPDSQSCYGIAWNFSPSAIREILDGELDIIFRKYVHEHNYKIFYGDSLGHFTNVFLRPVELKSQSSESYFALLKSGTMENIRTDLAKFVQEPETFIALKPPAENDLKNILPGGERYLFSQKMMQAVLLSNVVYPVYTQDQYIRHFTPGKWWNSLYTWDAGFIALGMSEIDPVKAIQILNAYTTPKESQSAFIHHGSPVPVQIYAFLDLWNKTQSEELIRYFYPRLKRYYEFLSGKTASSITRTFNSNLLKTWDYFYNSGGWDDYPPQKAVRDNGLEKTVSPVITTAQCIRMAKILWQTARVLDYRSDMQAYKKDINLFSSALQDIAWDKESGYFSYIVHDEANNPAGIFRHTPGDQNYNMGLDGAYPLFSGICTEEQQAGLLDKIFSEDHMWTRAGICVVDKAADYYLHDGYWNGAVWMPHQWFMWKTMLDLGRPDLAFKIADTALELWKKETDATYFTYEHFIVDIARGAGWHQFGALSAPVLNWFAAYYKPGTVTPGFEVWIREQEFDPDTAGYSASLSFDRLTKAHQRSILVCLNPSYVYEVRIDGVVTPCTERHRGLLEILLPAENKDCRLGITKRTG